ARTPHCLRSLPTRRSSDLGELYALPMDSGPMAMFYNKDIFDEHDIDVPETWDQYLEAARDLQAADPDAYILADDGDAGATTSRRSEEHTSELQSRFDLVCR